MKEWKVGQGTQSASLPDVDVFLVPFLAAVLSWFVTLSAGPFAGMYGLKLSVWLLEGRLPNLFETENYSFLLL